VNKEFLKCSQRDHEAWRGMDLKFHLFSAPGSSLNFNASIVLNRFAASNRDVYEVKIIPTHTRQPHVVQGRQLVFHALFTEKRMGNISGCHTRLKLFEQKHSDHLLLPLYVTY
jgi:hypothetical protein